MQAAGDHLAITIVGEASLGGTLRTAAADTDLHLDITTTTPGDVVTDRADADWVLLDQRRMPDQWQSVLTDINDTHPDQVVGLLIDDKFEATLSAAIRHGADDCIPRHLCEQSPGAVLERIAQRSESDPREDGSQAGGGDDADGERDRFDLITQNVAEVIYIANEDFSAVEYVNPAYERIWGRSVAELYEDATAFIEGIHPADREAFVDDFEAMQREINAGTAEDSYEFEFRVQQPEGDVRWVLANGYPVEVDGGENRYVGIVEDVTEQRELERTYRDFFESVSDGLVVHDPESGDIIDVNERYCEITGYDRDELVGANIELITAEGETDSLARAQEKIAAARTDGPQLFEFDAVRKNGEFWVGEVNLKAVTLRGEEQILASVRDVTVRRRRERAIRTLQRGTERMQTADSAAAIADIAVETAADALSVPAVGCWFHDAATATLEPVTATDALTERDLLVPLAEDCEEYDLFTAGDVTTYSPQAAHWDGQLASATVLPLGQHGLITAGQFEDRAYGEIMLDVARTLADHAVTALDRIAREKDLRENERRLEAIIDRIDDAIFLAPVSELDEGQPAPDFVSSGYADLFGKPLAEIQETYEQGFFDTLHPQDESQYREFLEGIIAAVDAGEAKDRYTTEYRIKRLDAGERWVKSDFYPKPWEDDIPRILIVSRDITDRKTRERTLESFQDATGELTTAETVAEAAAVAVEAAADVFDIPATAVYQYDDTAGDLQPIASGPAMPATETLTALTATHSQVWEPFVDGQMATVQAARTAPLALEAGDSVLLVPLGNNGLLAIWGTPGELDTEAANILAASLEAALNRLRGERRLESSRQELREQTERAERLEAITSVTQRVESAITSQSSRSGMYDAVTAELVDVAPFTGAWVAAAEVGTDQLTPRGVAGLDRDHAEQALAATGDDHTDPHPALVAWDAERPQVEGDLLGSGRQRPWRQRLLRAGAGSVCAVPLAHSGITYGVLVVVAEEPDAFGERAVEVLAQLGHSIGYANSAIDRKRALESDDTLELEFGGSGLESPFARLAREADCQVQHERTIRRQDGCLSVYYTVRDGVPAELESVASSVLSGDIEVVSQGDDQAVIERRGSTWIGSVVSEYGGVLRRGQATVDDVELVIELPHEVDTRTVIEQLTDTYPALTLRAQRHHRETAPEPGALVGRLQDTLTQRQLEALETAQAMGYFEWPRESSGEAVAERLDITQPTVNKHIRLGERKVFDLIFGQADQPPE
jgi:PAS domain S-box-containing protein